MKKDKKPEKNKKEDDFFRINTHNSIFDAFEDQFREMEERMNYFYRDTLSGNIPRPEEGGPKIYGYTYRVGPDGIPHYEEFTNMDQDQIPSQIPGQQKQLNKAKDPLVDIQESDKEIYVTIELPGIEKENIDLEVNNEKLTIKAEDKEHFFKEIKLPSEVKTKNNDAKFNNGVLSITLKKTKPKKKGKKINIE